MQDFRAEFTEISKNETRQRSEEAFVAIPAVPCYNTGESEDFL